MKHLGCYITIIIILLSGISFSSCSPREFPTGTSLEDDDEFIGRPSQTELAEYLDNTPSAQNSLPTIVFSSSRNDPNPTSCLPDCILEIFVYEPSTSEIVQITNMGGVSDEPDWSPDKQEIVFSSSVGNGDDDLYIVMVEGHTVRKVTSYPSSEIQPSWSPIDSEIAYVRIQDGDLDIYILDLTSGKSKLLVDNPVPDFQPSWSPDGSKIVFTSYQGGNEAIFIVNSDGSDLVQVTSGASNDWGGTWSPDGAAIIFTTDRFGSNELMSVILENGEQIRLTANSFDDISPSWNPVYFKVLYSVPTSSYMGIYFLDLETQQEQRITYSFDINPDW